VDWVSTIPQGIFFFINHPAKFFLRAPEGSLSSGVRNALVVKGWAEYFSRHRCRNLKEVPRPSPLPPILHLDKIRFRDFGAKDQNIGAKNQIFDPTKSKCGAKFKYHRQNSNSINFCTTKTFRFVREKLPTFLI